MITQLSDGWFLQSAEKAKVPGEKISSRQYTPDGWHPVTVPGTVVGGLVQSGALGDPYTGMNLANFPGQKGGNQTLHSLLPKTDDSPFRKPWWYRNKFSIKTLPRGKRMWLRLRGISYRANLWLNGKRVATAGHLCAPFRQADLDITAFVEPGKANVLALEVFSPDRDEFGVTFIDWSPGPPDESMGILYPPAIYTTGPVALRHPFVQARLDLKTLKGAALEIRATLINTAGASIAGTLEGKIGRLTFTRKVKLDGWEKREIVLSATDFPQLKISNPRLWWPYQLGRPELYRLQIAFRAGGRVSDKATVRFGIRDIRSRLNRHGARVFRINGRDLLIRGSTWSPDLLHGRSRTADEIHVAYLKNMNLNAVRLEGSLASDHFWDLCDKEGVLVLNGLPCCNHWENWKDWKEEDVQVARESVRAVLRNVRNHPSHMGYILGSDLPAPEHVEREYLDVIKETPIGVPVIGNSAARATRILGPTGMIHGPYSYVPPVYWYEEGAKHFNTETGPGTCIPLAESLRKMLPRKQRQVGSDAWNFHCGLQVFNHTRDTDKALRKRYGQDARNFQRYVDTSQVMGYELWRSMYEAWARNYPKATGVMGWMLNSCWPSMIWQMFDYYNIPLGAFYGTQKACQPIHVQYSYDDASVWAFNQTGDDLAGLVVRAQVVTPDARKVFEKTRTLNLGQYGRARVLAIPQAKEISGLYFLRLALEKGKKVLSTNTYWLSTRQDILERSHKNYQRSFFKPQSSFADLSPLHDLPRAKVDCSTRIKAQRSHFRLKTRIINTSERIAFFLWAKAYNRVTGELVGPVYWDENCITLLPGERAQLTGSVPGMHLKENDLDVKVTGWNTGRQYCLPISRRPLA